MIEINPIRLDGLWDESQNLCVDGHENQKTVLRRY